MESVSCPWCGEKVYSASFKVGKVNCPSCSGVFFIGYDEIRQLWTARDPKSPIQSMMIRKAKRQSCGVGSLGPEEDPLRTERRLFLTLSGLWSLKGMARRVSGVGVKRII